ncbi:MAG: IS30 family transposase [Patescibacteria group bacterium]|nr:IS30 family transposase [Patescibacteria group bacterium]
MSNLTFYDRERIEYYLNLKRLSLRDVAKLIGRNHTVVNREVKRNSAQFVPYSAELAQSAADRKSRITNKRKLDKDEILKKYVIDKLKTDWSPEQIAGKLKEHPPPNLMGKYINHESIYQYIYEVDLYLYNYLRKKHYVRKKQYSRTKQKVKIPDRVSIHTRTEEINHRQRFGDWESDLMEFSRQRNVLSVDYERKALMIRIHKLTSKGAKEKEDALKQTFEDLPNNLRKSITFDNGTENARHTIVKNSYQMATYFCDSYSSWQKGGVENINGLLRQYFPRNTNLNKVNETRLYQVQELLNNRPRKALHYLTPNEIIKLQVVH